MPKKKDKYEEYRVRYIRKVFPDVDEAIDEAEHWFEKMKTKQQIFIKKHIYGRNNMGTEYSLNLAEEITFPNSKYIVAKVPNENIIIKSLNK